MNWYQHLIVSLLAAHLVNVALGQPWTGALLAAAVLGAWLPDVDHQKTRIFHFALAVVFALVFAFAYLSIDATHSVKVFSATAIGLASALALFLLKPRHRGITHHPVAALIFGALVFLASQNAFAALNGCIAYGAHLAADRFS